MSRIFDTHAHYDDARFDADREALLAHLPQQGVKAVVNVGASITSSRQAIDLAEQYPYMYAAVGVHPSEVAALTEPDMEWLEQAAAHEKVVAIGEIGLDYHWDEPGKDIQRHWFERQLELTKKLKMPVIIHSRDAAQDTFDLMKKHHQELCGGVIHCFSYSANMAEAYVEMGYRIGIGGVVTFKNARVTKEVVAAIPLSAIVLETDCPYLAPEPHRGERNSSLYLRHVVKAISEIKQVSEEEVRQQTWDNACQLYRRDID